MKSIDSIPFDLHALQAFVAVCESGSVTQAARLLGVTASAISQLIKTIEVENGVTLLDRDFRPSRPTDAGRVMLELASELLDHARRVSVRLAETSRSGNLQLRMGCVDSFAATVGPALVKAISGTSRQITMWSGLTPMLNEQLRERELDMAIVTEAALKDPRIVERELLSESFVAIVPRPVKGKAPRDLRDVLDKLPLIRYTLRSVIGQQVDRYIRHLGIDSPRRFEFDATDPLMSMVASGLGCAITTPLCLWQARHYLPEVAVMPLPSSEIGQRKFILLSRQNEMPSLSAEISRLTRQVLKTQIIPRMQKELPGLPANAIRYL
jgi:DNA-binding transcriptional LysR family regulator